jgi:hypothetical protein
MLTDNSAKSYFQYIYNKTPGLKFLIVNQNIVYSIVLPLISLRIIAITAITRRI